MLIRFLRLMLSVGFTCTCAGSNAKVRIGVGPDMEYKVIFSPHSCLPRGTPTLPQHHRHTTRTRWASPGDYPDCSCRLTVHCMQGCYVDGGRDLEIMELSGDAHFDADFGLTLDGADDFATVTDPHNMDYSPT